MTVCPRRGRGWTRRGATSSAQGRIALAIAASLASALAGADAEAAPGASRVVIVRERSADPVIDRAEVRVAAELRSAGFDVDERVVEGDEDARQLVEEPGEPVPFATVLLRRAGGRAATDVWVADHVTHKTVVRRIGAPGSDGSDRALALRVVELMRASLVEGLVLPAPASESESASPSPSAPPAAAPAAPASGPPPDVLRWTREAIREPAPSAPPRIGFAVGVLGIYAGPDVGPALGPALRATWHATRAWSVGALGSTVFGGDVPAHAEGTAMLRQDFGLVEVAFEQQTDSPLHLFASAGGGVYHLFASGNANAPYVSLKDDAWTALFAGGAGIRWRLTSAASLVVDLRELLAAPRPVVQFASERAALIMRPGTLAALSLAVDL
jgi:hypothetical protein